MLCKMRVPLQEFASLKVGDSMPLDSAFLYETDLLTIGGKPVAQGRLGQMNGSRAVRLNPPRNGQPRNGGAEAAMAFSEGGGMEALPEPAAGAGNGYGDCCPRAAGSDG